MCVIFSSFQCSLKISFCKISSNLTFLFHHKGIHIFIVIDVTVAIVLLGLGKVELDQFVWHNCSLFIVSLHIYAWTVRTMLPMYSSIHAFVCLLIGCFLYVRSMFSSLRNQRLVLRQWRLTPNAWSQRMFSLQSWLFNKVWLPLLGAP
jgi:hypothetical protein